MAARIPRVTAVTVLEHYRLRVTFDDGLIGDVDVSDLKDAGPVFEPLRSSSYFAKVHVDGRTVAWPGEIDLDPEALYADASKHRVSSARKRHTGTNRHKKRAVPSKVGTSLLQRYLRTVRS